MQPLLAEGNCRGDGGALTCSILRPKMLGKPGSRLGWAAAGSACAVAPGAGCACRLGMAAGAIPGAIPGVRACMRQAAPLTSRIARCHKVNQAESIAVALWALPLWPGAMQATVPACIQQQRLDHGTHFMCACLMQVHTKQAGARERGVWYVHRAGL